MTLSYKNKVLSMKKSCTVTFDGEENTFSLSGDSFKLQSAYDILKSVVFGLRLLDIVCSHLIHNLFNHTRFTVLLSIPTGSKI